MLDFYNEFKELNQGASYFFKYIGNKIEKSKHLQECMELDLTELKLKQRVPKVFNGKFDIYYHKIDRLQVVGTDSMIIFHLLNHTPKTQGFEGYYTAKDLSVEHRMIIAQYLYMKMSLLDIEQDLNLWFEGDSDDITEFDKLEKIKDDKEFQLMEFVKEIIKNII